MKTSKKVEEMQKRMRNMRRSLQEKNELFEAMQKNFALLEGMTQHQAKELKLLKKQNVKLKASYQSQNTELK